MQYLCSTELPPVVDKSHAHSATTGMLNIPTLNTLSPVAHPLCSPQFIVELWSLMLLRISYILLPVTWPSLVCSTVPHSCIPMLCHCWLIMHQPLNLWTF